MIQLSELRASLPNDAFEPSVVMSLAYVAFDTICIAALAYGQYQLHHSSNFIYTYPLYAFLQGTFMWAYFVLGHDCGHGSFSKSDLLNDIIGTFTHTVICVPFYPWKLSHRHHHQNTGNIDKEEVFHPVRQTDWDAQTTGGRFMKAKSYLGLGLGWFTYLAMGYSMRVSEPDRVKSHYSLDNPLFAQYQTGVSWSLWYCSSIIFGVGD